MRSISAIGNRSPQLTRATAAAAAAAATITLPLRLLLLPMILMRPLLLLPVVAPPLNHLGVAGTQWTATVVAAAAADQQPASADDWLGSEVHNGERQPVAAAVDWLGSDGGGGGGGSSLVNNSELATELTQAPGLARLIGALASREREAGGGSGSWVAVQEQRGGGGGRLPRQSSIRTDAYDDDDNGSTGSAAVDHDDESDKQQQRRPYDAGDKEGGVAGGDGSGSSNISPPTVSMSAAAAAIETSGSQQQLPLRLSSKQEQRAEMNQRRRRALSGSVDLSDQQQRPPDAAAAENQAKPVDPQPATAESVDSRMAQFIKLHLLSAEPPDERTEALTRELDKVYRVLRFAGKVAHKLDHERGSIRPATVLARSSSSDGGDTSGGGGSELALASAAANGLADTIRRHSGRKIVGRLAKKADWNALFVKLAKVFLQYFLDLILNDMFGTTGTSRSFVGTDIDLRKSLKDFLRLASGLPS